MRWNKKFDGTKESLLDKSHHPLSPHPNDHTEQELKWIENYLRRNPHISMCELYGKLRVEKGYSRNASSLFRVLRKMGIYVNKEKKERYTPKKYDTPSNIGIKWQMDVKYVPKYCYSGNDGQKFYQYTIIDECTRERFIYAYKEQCADSTVDFVKRALIYFGYAPKCIQTDNGQEFTFLMQTDRVHKFDMLCEELGIIHKLIKPRTPRHNGKVERSHRNDNERFYKYLKFYSFEDLQLQMKAYLKRSNNIPSIALGWKTPLQVRKEHMLNDWGVIE